MPATPTLAPFRYAPRIYDQGRAKEWGFADPRSLPLLSTDLRPGEGLKDFLSRIVAE